MGNTGSFILNDDSHELHPNLFDKDRDGPVGRRILDGIDQVVRQHLLDAAWIGQNKGLGSLDVNIQDPSRQKYFLASTTSRAISLRMQGIG